MAVLRERDEAAVVTGELLAVRTDSKLQQEVLKDHTPLCGKKDTLEAHLRNCELVSKNIRKTAGREFPEEDDDVVAEGPPRKKQKKTEQAKFEVVRTESFTPARQATFAADLCRLIVACNFAWACSLNPEFLKFFAKWVPGADVPAPRTLGGRVLKQEVVKVEGDVHSQLKGKYLTGASDGWKDVSKNSLVGTTVTCEYKAYTLHVHDVSKEAKTADNLLTIVKGEYDFIRNVLMAVLIAWVSDAGGDSRAMRKRLQREYPWLIVLDCWAHQINLIIGDLLKSDPLITETVTIALLIIKWFSNHSRASAVLKRTQEAQLMKSHNLIHPVVTRWTAHYLSFKRLLEVAKAIRTCVISDEEELKAAAGKKAKDIQRAERIFAHVNDKTFWSRLADIKAQLEPLAIAQNVAQASATRLDQVLLTLANLWRVFDDRANVADRVRIAVHASLEKRWLKADQDAFVLALFLNPYVRADLFNSEDVYGTGAALYGLVKRMWTRVFPDKPIDMGLYKATIAYYNRDDEFSDEAMNLAELEHGFEAEGKPLDLLEVWKQLDRKDVWTGRVQLTKLAILILSIVANSADLERLFSQMGVIHSDERNRLGFQKVRDMAVLRTEMRREHAEAGLVRERLKRKYAPDETLDKVDTKAADTETLAMDAIEASEKEVDEDFGVVAEDLIHAADDDDIGEDEDESGDITDVDPETSASAGLQSTTPRIKVYFGTHRPVALSQLFNYASPVTTGSKKGLDMFWKGAVRNLEKELELYDLLDVAQRAANEEDERLASDNARDSGTMASPLELD